MEFVLKQYRQALESKLANQNVDENSVQNNDSEQHLEDMKLYDYADRLREFFPSLSPKDESH